MGMMKLLLRYLLLFIITGINAQSISKSTVGNAGIELIGSEEAVSFTIGEQVIGLIANTESIDQGFWAGSLFVEPISPQKGLNGMMVYPNPMIHELNIQTKSHTLWVYDV